MLGRSVAESVDSAPDGVRIHVCVRVRRLRDVAEQTALAESRRQ